MNSKKISSIISIIVLIISIPFLSSCKSGKKPVSPTPKTEDGVTVTIFNSKGYFQKGNNDFKLEFMKGGKPFDVGKNVTLYLYMPAMPPSMPEMRNDAEITVSKTGQYKGKIKIEMHGKWQVNIGYSEKTMAFDVNVRK